MEKGCPRVGGDWQKRNSVPHALALMVAFCHFCQWKLEKETQSHGSEPITYPTCGNLVEYPLGTVEITSVTPTFALPIDLRGAAD